MTLRPCPPRLNNDRISPAPFLPVARYNAVSTCPIPCLPPTPPSRAEKMEKERCHSPPPISLSPFDPEKHALHLCAPGIHIPGSLTANPATLRFDTLA
ncbi:hypothetical protein K431DRAFT_285782 [Polychaeton citri CBS 116435]|uniref:Uncharacterized protein n=1 Tax=Polychaeton citri CBS 116435 TaxID=1314669 RepID=A0A9P4UNA4_9PEZI|nr:hypothetical protein K431DRAFT_285782 [Polychaeton citri CBS 116435]